MGLKLCSECKREVPRVEHVKSSSTYEESDSTDCIRYPSKEKLKTQFSSVTVKPLKLAKLNIDIVSGNATTPRASGGLRKSEVPESPSCRFPRGLSLRQKLNERKLIDSCPHTPLGYYDEEEAQAEKVAQFYMGALEDSTLHHAKEANRVTESMVEKGAEISAELMRSGNVVRQANRNMRKVEQEINQTKRTINGMTLKGKVTNFWRRKPKKIGYPDDSERGSRDYLPRSISLPAKFACRSSLGDSKQKQIKDNVKQLIHNMDTLREQNLGIAEELVYQEPHLQTMSDNMGRVQNEIVRQTTRINQMH